MTATFAKQFFRTFGSLKLGVFVLSILAGVLIFATVYESKTSTRQAQMLVYQNWWFVGLLSLLGLNVFCAALARYPWKGYQSGFVITHFGILALLLGSIVGLLFGVEGSLTMEEGGRPVSFIRQDYDVLAVTPHDTGQTVDAPLQLESHSWTPGQTRRLKLRGLPLDLRLTAFYPQTKEELIVQGGGTEFNPALRFTFDRKREGREPSGMKAGEWLVAKDAHRKSMALGPARFTLEMIDSPEALQRRLQPPPAPTAAQAKGLLHLEIQQQSLDIPVGEYLGKEFKSTDGKIIVRIKDYFADFRMDTANKRPMSVSDQPHNPAVVFELSAGEGRCTGFAFADFPEMNLLRNTNLPDAAVKAAYRFDRAGLETSGHGGISSTITVLVGPGEQLHYTSVSTKSSFEAGELKVGQAVSPGGPVPAQFKVEEFHPRARLSTRIVPAPEDPASPFASPAVEVRLRQGNQTNGVLVRWGQPVSVTVGNSAYDLIYRYAMVPLDFSIELQKFAAPKYEGTAMPAGFESYVRVKDAKTGDALEKKIWMNHPLTYRGYRFSQASYDEGSGGAPTRSTLQALRDPGWPLKWLGSILIISGLMTMFYLKPYLKGRLQHQMRQAAPSPQAQPSPQWANLHL